MDRIAAYPSPPRPEARLRVGTVLTIGLCLGGVIAALVLVSALTVGL